ncbi:MAG: tetratricopeptide repeat protein [Nitrospinae bacterium]|nr:tetratricopeptide repeat protein [Nitrospinota bacterium]
MRTAPPNCAANQRANSKASPYYTSYAYSNLGILHTQFGNYPKAEAAFKEGIRIKPSLPTNYFNLGNVYAQQGRYLKAKDAYDKAERLYHEYRWGYKIPPELYLNKARVLLILGIHTEAEEAAVDYLQRIPDSGPGHFRLGTIYAAMGKEEEAIREYQLSGDDPKLRAEAHNNTAIIFIKRDQADRALEELKQAVTLSPSLLDAHYNMGRLLAETGGDMEKARNHLEIALKLSPNLESRKRVQQVLNSLP